jgi:hypothetical protein
VHLDRSFAEGEHSVRPALDAALFKDGTLSLGGAVRLSGMIIPAFLQYLGDLGVDVVRCDGWLVVDTHARESVPLTPSLGLGESDSIRLSLEDREHSLLIMDDRLARRYALRKGLTIVGSVRLLDMAERRGLIESAEGCIRQMSDFGYRVSIDLLEQIRFS